MLNEGVLGSVKSKKLHFIPLLFLYFCPKSTSYYTYSYEKNVVGVSVYTSIGLADGAGSK